MASSVLDDDSLDSFESKKSVHIDLNDPLCNYNKLDNFICEGSNKFCNVTAKLLNRQIYGRITKHPRAKTEKMFDDIHYKCRYKLDHIIRSEDDMDHIYMGFTLCGKYFISYNQKFSEDQNTGPMNLFPVVEYELFVWQFVPGEQLRYVSKHRIFKHLKSAEGLDEITFMQFPGDPYKLICYGLSFINPIMAFLTVLTLPSPKNCRNCKENGRQRNISESRVQGWCHKHGFTLHTMLSMAAQPTPIFSPHISLAFPDYIVINTGHYMHIINVSTFESHSKPMISLSSEKELYIKLASMNNSCNFIDTLSELSESVSEQFDNNSIVDAILDDFNEYDLESSNCNKPFHELNISCEPLNVTGKSYHNTNIQTITDPRLKRLQSSNKDCVFSMPQTSGLQKPMEKSKIDKKIAEEAYEFTEENEKCEKISLFRKKRLADKKYEFSEDNNENIVPFYSLRREKHCVYRPQARCIKSPDRIFLSPRSPGFRSPMQSPNSRCGQFSPGGARNLYCPIIRSSPHHSKSPISPKESARKFNVYSPGLDSDCSDTDSKLIMRHPFTCSTSHVSDHKLNSNRGLLIVDSKREEKPKWIKKLVKRFSSVDFENSSLVSGQSRDDYNIPIEIPLLVQTMNDQHLDVVPEFKIDHVSEMQLIVTQRTFDCEQFVHHRAQKLCLDAELEFLHCEDYDIRLLYICPLNGHIVCKAVIKIGALQSVEPCGKPQVFVANCIFTWNIESDAFEVIEPADCFKLQPLSSSNQMPQIHIPTINHKNVLVMDQVYQKSKRSLRDYHEYYEICMENDYYCSWENVSNYEFSIPSDSE